MSKFQYHGIIGPIWLIASNTSNEPWFAAACAAMFAGHSIIAAVNLIRDALQPAR